MFAGAATLTFAAGIAGNIERLSSFLEGVWQSTDPTSEELIYNVADYIVPGEIERLNVSGALVVTPVGLFRFPGTPYDRFPAIFTYLLCRLTNTIEQPITLGALVDDRGEWYGLADDPKFGYRPTATTLMQWQYWFRGRPVERRQLVDGEVEIPPGFLEAATIDAGRTKYCYIDSRGRRWRNEINFKLIDVTDSEIGAFTLRVDLGARGRC